MLQKLPIGIQTFSDIINDDNLYVDKTEVIHRLLTSGKYFFLSRPRRSGKSLTLSTIKSIYQGERALFAGLWIEEHTSSNSSSTSVQRMRSSRSRRKATPTNTWPIHVPRYCWASTLAANRKQWMAGNRRSFSFKTVVYPPPLTSPGG